MLIKIPLYNDRGFVNYVGIQVEGTVPGSIYTDLEKANVFTGGPLLFRFNDLDYRWVSYQTWDYSLTFQSIIFLFFFHIDRLLVDLKT